MKIFLLSIFAFLLNSCLQIAAQETVPWYPVAGIDINLRSEPSITAPIIRTISYGKSVKILSLNPEIVTFNGITGHWALIQYNWNSERLWMFDYYIATPERFAVAQNTAPREIHFCIGDYCPDIIIHNNGTYTSSWRICLGGGPCTDQERVYCAKIHGTFIEEKSNPYTDARCLYESRLKSYREVYWFETAGFYLVYMKNNQVCAIPRGHYECAN